MPSPKPVPTSKARKRQQGMALIVVLAMMSIVFVVAAISVRLTMLSERASRNDRDRQIAFQSAEAALADAELDIFGPNTASNSRCALIEGSKTNLFTPACGTDSSTKTRGLCTNVVLDIPLYTQINFEEISDSARKYSTLGEFTGRAANFKSSNNGGLSAKIPGYIIEKIQYFPPLCAIDAIGACKPTNDVAPSTSAFLVTSVGYGTSTSTKVMLQALFHKPASTPGC